MDSIITYISRRREPSDCHVRQRVRELNTEEVLFLQAVAERLGIGLTDLQCMDIIYRIGPLTAGRLAELTGFTTGGVTGIVDRLEKAGLARRERDPKDRRSVIIQPVQERLPDVERFWESLNRGTAKELASYTEKDLEPILDFLTRGTQLLHKEVAKL